eukprot:NODE_459_length_8196_cov_0.388539.p5 type:complete len:123 gc:universal NODE_459_length_8196_cov_0.388539:5109-4741(-)
MKPSSTIINGGNTRIGTVSGRCMPFGLENRASIWHRLWVLRFCIHWAQPFVLVAAQEVSFLKAQKSLFAGLSSLEHAFLHCQALRSNLMGHHLRYLSLSASLAFFVLLYRGELEHIFWLSFC